MLRNELFLSKFGSAEPGWIEGTLSLCVLGQYYEKCGGSSSSVTINTTNIPLGAEVIEVMVYRKRERRKYTPLSTDSTVYIVTGGEKKTHFLSNKTQTRD